MIRCLPAQSVHRLLIEDYAEIEISAARRPVIARSVNRRRRVDYRRRRVDYRRRRSIVDVITLLVRIGAVVAPIVIIVLFVMTVVMFVMPISLPGHTVVRHSEYKGYQNQNGYKYLLHDSSPFASSYVYINC